MSKQILTQKQTVDKLESLSYDYMLGYFNQNQYLANVNKLKEEYNVYTPAVDKVLRRAKRMFRQEAAYIKLNV